MSVKPGLAQSVPDLVDELKKNIRISVIETHGLSHAMTPLSQDYKVDHRARQNKLHHESETQEVPGGPLRLDLHG